MQMGVQKETVEDRPLNDLLQRLSRKDFILLEPHIVIQNIGSHEILYNPGDVVEDVCFPCDRSLVSFVISMEDGRKVQAALVGREGAVGGIVGRGSQPAHSHIVVKTAGLVSLSKSWNELGGSRRRCIICFLVMLIVCLPPRCNPLPATRCIPSSNGRRNGSARPSNARLTTRSR